MIITILASVAVVLLVLFLIAVGMLNDAKKQGEKTDAALRTTKRDLFAERFRREEQYANHLKELISVKGAHRLEVVELHRTIDRLRAACSDHLKSLELALSGHTEQARELAPKPSGRNTVKIAVDLDTSAAEAKVKALKDKVDEVQDALPAGPKRDARGRFAPKVAK